MAAVENQPVPQAERQKATAFDRWMSFARGLNLVVTTILFSALFVILLPFVLIKLTDPLRFNLRRSDTYWEDHQPHEPTLERMIRAF